MAWGMNWHLKVPTFNDEMMKTVNLAALFVSIVLLAAVFKPLKHHAAAGTVEISSMSVAPDELHNNCYRNQMVEACQALGAYYVQINDSLAAQQTFDHACALGDPNSCRGHSKEETILTSNSSPN